MLTNILTNIVGVIIGGGITWFFSWRYYNKAGKELLAQAARLARLHDITLNAMEDAGMVRLNREEGFRIVGREVHARNLDGERGTVVSAGDVIVDTMEDAIREGRAIESKDVVRREPNQQ